jgi:PBP1b-binding outer membrane lipoprotein LpoB
MKRITICLIGAIILSSCINEVADRPDEGEVEEKSPPSPDFLFSPEGVTRKYNLRTYTLRGMDYGIFYVTDGGSVEFRIVNFTKDSLEVEKLKNPFP